MAETGCGGGAEWAIIGALRVSMAKLHVMTSCFTQVHVARSLAVATGGGAVAVVTAAEVSTLTTLSSPSLQKVQALSRPTLLQVNAKGVHCSLSIWK